MREEIKKWLENSLHDESELVRDSYNERNIDSDYIDGLTPMDDELSVILGKKMSKYDIPRHSFMRTNVDWAHGHIIQQKLTAKVVPVSARYRNGDSRVMQEAEYRAWQVKATWDANRYRDEFSRIVRDACVSGEGIGRIEIVKRNDKRVNRLRHRNWRGIWYDTQSTRDTFDDCRYLFDLGWIDIELIAMKYKKSRHELELFAQEATLNKNVDRSLDDTRYGSRNYYETSGSGNRRQVLYGQAWYRDITDENNVKYAPVIVNSDMSSIMFLKKETIPFAHNKIPYIRVVADRYASTGLPYSPLVRLRRGQERFMQYPFRSIIEQASGRKAIASIEAVPKDEEGRPVATLDNFIRKTTEFLNNPSGVMVIDGEVGRGNFEVLNNDAVLQNMVNLFTILQQSSERSGLPIDPALLGQSTNLNAAVALQEKAKQAHLSLNRLNNSYVTAVEEAGILTLANIMQFGDDMEFVSPSMDDGTTEPMPEAPEIIDEIRMNYRIMARQRDTGFESEQIKLLMEMSKVVPPELHPTILYLANSVMPFGSDGAMRDFSKMLIEKGFILPDSVLDNSAKQLKEQTKARNAEMQQQQQAVMQRAQEAEISKKEAEAEKITAEAMHKEIQAGIAMADASQPVEKSNADNSRPPQGKPLIATTRS